MRKTTIHSKFNLKTGLALAIIFPAVFSFSQPAIQSFDILVTFFNYFLFILISWIVNYAVIDFNPIIRKQDGRLKRRLYLKMLFTSFLAIPLYMGIGELFNKEEFTLAYVFSNNYSLKGWFFFTLRIVLFNAGILLTKYLYDNNLEQRKILLENETLKREHLNAVHESLKQQVDPHFLFNTLNTLQSLVKQDSALTLKFISEFSSVYRYMLLRRDNKYVTVKDEIEFLKSYLYLLKIRFGEAIQSQIMVEDKYLSTLIPPHTLQMLAENTVKHNKLSVKNPLKITIHTKPSFLVISNNISRKAAGSEISGVGLNNINSRYHLLFGKEIRVEKETAAFHVYLPIVYANESIDNRR